MTVESFALWFGIITGIIGTVAVLIQYGWEKVLKNSAIFTVLILSCVAVWLLIKNYGSRSVAAGPSDGSVSQSAIARKSMTPAMNSLIHDVIAYKKSGLPIFDVSEDGPIFRFIVPATDLIETLPGKNEWFEDDLVEAGYTKDDLEYLNECTVTDPHAGRFTLSRDGKSLTEILIFYDGRAPNGQILSKTNDYLRGPLKMGPDMLTSAFSDDLAIQLRKELHAKFGAPTLR